MDEAARYRTFVETREYSDQFESLAQIYSDEVIERLLQGVFWGLASNAEQERQVRVLISFDPDPFVAQFLNPADLLDPRLSS